MRDAATHQVLPELVEWQDRFDQLADSIHKGDERTGWEFAYQRNYFGAKLAALQSSFTHTRNQLGDKHFQLVATAYINSADDVAENLNLFGNQFPAYVMQYCDDFDLAADIGETAQYERCYQQAYYAPEFAIDFSCLASIDMKSGQEVLLTLNPSLQLGACLRDVIHRTDARFSRARDYIIWFNGEMMRREYIVELDRSALEYLTQESRLNRFVDDIPDAQTWLPKAMTNQWLIAASLHEAGR